MNSIPQTNLEGTVDSDKAQKAIEIEGLLKNVEKPNNESHILLTIKKDDSTTLIVKYSYGDHTVAEKITYALRDYEGNRVRLKMGKPLNRSGDYVEGLGPVQFIQDSNKQKKEVKQDKMPENNLDFQRRLVLGKMNCVKVINQILEEHLFPHGITCEPIYRNYYNNEHYESSDYEFFDSRNSTANESSIDFVVVRKGFFGGVKSALRVASITGIADDLRSSSPIFDENGFHNIKIVPIRMKETYFSTSQYEAGIVNPLRSFGAAYEKASQKHAFMRVEI